MSLPCIAIAHAKDLPIVALAVRGHCKHDNLSIVALPARSSTCLASQLPRVPAICLSLPLSCMAITSVAVYPSLPSPRMAIASVAICPYSHMLHQLLTRRCSCHGHHRFACCRTCRACEQRFLVTSCWLHSCSHPQLLNPFSADFCVASCCATALRLLLLSIWTSLPSNPFAWHVGHIVIWPCASGVTIAVLGQPACCTLFINLFASHQFICQNEHIGPCTMATRQWGKRDTSMMTCCGVPVAPSCSLQWEGAGTVAE